MPSVKARSPRLASVPQEAPVTDMTGGLDLRRSQTLMAPDRSRTLRNWSLEEPGALIVGPGYTQVSSAAIFAGAPQGGQRVYLANAGAFTLLAGAGGVYKPNASWASTGPVLSSLSTANQVFFPHDRDLVAVMDGANRPKFSTNGTDWYLMGTDAPSSAAAASSLSSGALSSGEYAFAYTYKHRGTAHESNGSSESTITISASTGAVHLTASPSTDGKVDAYVWYGRHKTPDGESVLRKISSGAASTVRITSSAWTTNDEIPTNHNAPTALSFGAVWKSRWWAKDATVGNRLRFTELFQPQSWPSLYYIDIPFERGDSITAIQPLGDTLIVYGQSGMFLVIGQTALDFEVRPSVGSDAGTFGPRSALRVEQAAVHASADSIATFDGATDRALEPDIAPAWRDLAKGSASTALAGVAAVHDYQRHEARLAVPRVYPTAAAGEFVLALDRTRDNGGTPAWTTTDRDVAVYIHFNGNEATVGDRGRLFFLTHANGHVYEHSTATAAVNSSDVRAEYEGAGLSFGARQARLIGTHVEYEPNDGAFSIEALVDGVSQGSQSINIGAGLARYGTARYGTDVYGGGNRLQAFLEWPLEAEGHTIVTRGTYLGNRRFKWFGYTHEVVPEGIARRM